MKERNIIPDVTPENLFDINYNLDTYFNNFFNYLNPGTYIFASCGSFDEDIESKIKTITGSAEELDEMLQRVSEESQNKEYSTIFYKILKNIYINIIKLI